MGGLLRITDYTGRAAVSLEQLRDARLGHTLVAGKKLTDAVPVPLTAVPPATRLQSSMGRAEASPPYATLAKQDSRARRADDRNAFTYPERERAEP